MTLEELHAELARLIEEMRRYLDEHEDENGELTEEEAATYDRMNQKVTALKKKIERHEGIAKVDNYLSQPTSKPILTNPNAYGGGWDVPTSDKNIGGRTMRPSTSNIYRQEFIGAIRDNFRNAVTNSFLREGALPQGGYLVPTELDEKIVAHLEEENVMRQLCRVITTQSDHKIDIVASKPAATWTAEGASVNFSNEEFGQIVLEAFKLTCAIKISNELLQDSFYDIESHIIEQFTNAIANAEEQAFILGDGNGKPTGLLTSVDEMEDAIITTSAPEITCDDLISLEYALPRAYRKNAVFLTNDATLAQIRRLKDSTENFIWTPSLAEGEPARLLGYSIYTTPFMPPARSGAIGIIFGDLRAAYCIADRGNRTFQPLTERFADEDCVAFIMRQRCDGKLVDGHAVKALRIQ